MTSEEKTQLSWDWTKHIATLSGGAIVLGAGSLKDFLGHSHDGLVMACFVSFAMALVGTTMVQADFFRDKKSTLLGFGGTLLATYGFLFGMILVVAYVCMVTSDVKPQKQATVSEQIH